MPDVQQLPHLLKLLDDDSPVVREAVFRELESFGEALEPELRKLAPDLDGYQSGLLERFQCERKRKRLLRRWAECFRFGNDLDKLENAVSLLSDYQSLATEKPLAVLLTELAEEYQRKYPKIDVYTLSHFLFQEKQIKGAPPFEYYAPCNSDLRYVLTHKKGLPISLVLIYQFVGRRVGLTIEGCNYPEHFLARVSFRGRIKWVDCFNGGIFIDEDRFLARGEHEGGFEVVHAKADAETVASRILHNLMRAYREDGNDSEERFMGELLKILEKESL